VIRRSARAVVRAMRAYPVLLRIGLAEAIAYRAEMFVWMLSMTMPLVMLALWSAVAESGSIGRFGQDTFTAYFLGTLVVRQLSGSWVVWEMIYQIREGTFSMRLLRPIHPLVALSAESFAAVPMRAFLTSPIIFLVIGITDGEHLVAGTHDTICFFLSMFGAWLLNFSISAIIGTLAMFLQSTMAIWDVWMGSFMLLSGYLVPLELFPPWLERTARVLPFAYLQSVPVEILAGLRTGVAAEQALFAQWAWVAGVLLILSLLWRRAVRHYEAFGG